MNKNEVLQMMNQLEVEHDNALSRWNELRRWLEYCLQQQAAEQSVKPTFLHAGCGGEIVQTKPYCKKCRVVNPQSG